MPMPAVNKHDMLRQIDSLFRDPAQKQAQLYANAEDFQLFHIANYTDKTGNLEGIRPQHIANLHEIKAAIQNRQPSLDS